MSSALLVLAGLAGLACPLHMWWRARRGEQAICCPPTSVGDSRQALRERQRALEAQIVELAGRERG